MNELYPIKFRANLKERIWGGERLISLFGKRGSSDKAIGESWEISGIEGDVSEVENGFLQGNNLQELIEIYMGDLIGEKVYQKFGIEFPLLFKFIDAEEVLSIQVHPDDDLARKRHNAYGKTEMWYVIDANEDAGLILGFKQKLNRESYLSHFESGNLPGILKTEGVKKGDAFFIPAGKVHAIGKGILLAEIQQTSDVTYRIYDWERRDAEGKSRELHVDLALDAIDFKDANGGRINYDPELNKTTPLAKCDYFTSNLLNFNETMARNYIGLDSFVVYMCTEGACLIDYGKDETISLKQGESILIPNELSILTLIPEKPTTILEVYID